MSKKYSIRHLIPEDVEIYKSIRLEALRINPEAFVGAYEEEILYNNDDFRKTLDSADIFGAFHEGQIIGIIGFNRPVLKKIRHEGELISLYITPEFRSLGIGSSLMKHAIEYAKSYVLQLCLYCNTENHALIKFYEKHGFTTFGLYPRGMKAGDRFYDANIMFLKLDD